MCKNRSVLQFFPFVSNCLHSSAQTPGPNLQTTSSHALTVRRLVSIYILRHAHLSPDLALLSVNAWQKDLSDSNPVIRSLALKTLAGMALESVLPLVVLTINRLLNDSNWSVRRTVAESLIIVHKMDSESYRESLIEGPLRRMLKDHSPLVLGSVLTAWEVICPTRWDLIHQNYRFYCRSLLDADENGQNVIMRVMTRYVREHLRNPQQAQGSGSGSVSDPDLDLLLNGVTVLFHSRNPSILISASNVFLYLAPPSRLALVTEPLMRLMHQSFAEREPEIALVLLHQIYHIIQVSLSQLAQHPFKDYLSDFYVSCAGDARGVKLIKLKILVTFVSSGAEQQIQAIIKELEFYIRDPDSIFVKEVIKAVGDLAAKTAPQTQSEALKLLVRLTKDCDCALVNDLTYTRICLCLVLSKWIDGLVFFFFAFLDHVICAAIEVMRSLVSTSPTATTSIFPNIHQLMTELIQLLIRNTITTDSTRANVYWLLGESNYQVLGPKYRLIQVLKFAISNFIKEGHRSKLQVLGLVTKSLIMSFVREAEVDSSVIEDERRMYQLGFDHLIRLARYDKDFGVRDRARYLYGLMKSGGLSLNEPETRLVEVLDEGRQSVKPVSMAEAFSRGGPIPGGEGLRLTSFKVDLDVLKRIMFRERMSVQAEKLSTRSEKGVVVNSMYRMLGLASTSKSEDGKDLLSWNAMPAWTKLPLDPSIRDAELVDQSSKLGLNTSKLETGGKPSSSSSCSDPSIQLRRGTGTSRTERVVLVPTESGGSQAKRPAYRNLNQFLESSEEESESEEESDEEEEEEEGKESGDEEEESSGDEEESGSDGRG